MNKNVGLLRKLLFAVLAVTLSLTAAISVAGFVGSSEKPAFAADEPAKVVLNQESDFLIAGYGSTMTLTGISPSGYTKLASSEGIPDKMINVKIPYQINVPSSVTDIAFQEPTGTCESSNLVSLVIPANVTTIYEQSVKNLFVRDSFVTVSSSSALFAAEDGALIDRGQQMLIKAPINAIKDGVYNLPQEIDGMGAIRRIGQSAFEGMTQLTEISFDEIGAIMANAFKGTSLTGDIVFPDGLTWILESAFENCNITSVYLGKNLNTIEVNAFAGNEIQKIELATGNSYFSLENGILYNKAKTSIVMVDATVSGELVIPEGITSLSEGAFMGNKNITSVVLPDTLKTVPKNAFKDCTGLTGVQFGAQTTSIGVSAFDGCTYLSGDIVIPEGVTEIPNYAFRGSNLDSVTIGANVTKIGTAAFTIVNTINLDEDNGSFVLDNGILYDAGKLRIIMCDGTVSGEVTIPEGVSSLNSGLFEANTRITKVILPDSIRTIPFSAFKNCTNLQSVTSPNVNTIASSAFEGCVSLKVIESSALTEIGTRAFFGCTNLLRVSGSADGMRVYDSAFENCRNLITVTALTNVGRSAFKNCTSLPVVTVSGDIAYNAFDGCTKLSSVNLKEGVEYILDYAFSGTAIKSLTLPSTSNEIYQYAFNECTQLTQITIEGERTSALRIDATAFRNCNKITTVYTKASSISASSVTQFRVYSPNIRFVLTDTEEVGTKYNNLVSKLYGNDKKLVTYEIEVTFKYMGFSTVEPRLVGQPYNYRKQADGSWAIDSDWQFKCLGFVVKTVRNKQLTIPKDDPDWIVNNGVTIYDLNDDAVLAPQTLSVTLYAHEVYIPEIEQVNPTYGQDYTIDTKDISSSSITYYGTTNAGSSYRSKNEPTEAGTYELRIDFSLITEAAIVYDFEGNLLEGTTYTAMSFTIARANINMSGYTMSNKTVTYDGTAQSITMSGTRPTGITAVSYTYNGAAGTSKRNAGTYTVRAVFTYDSNNYNAPAARSATLKIDKANIVMTSYTMSDKTVTYNGSAQSITMSGTMPTGITAVSYTYNGTAGTSATNAGTYTVAAVFTYEIANYNAPDERSATLTIKKATINMSGYTLSNKSVVYNGSSQSGALVMSGTQPTGITGVTYSYKNSSGTTVAAANVKNYGTYTVTATFTVNSNYEPVAAKSATLTIKKATISMSGYTLSDKSVVYNGSSQSGALVMSGTQPTGITGVTYSYKNSSGTAVTAANVKNVGTYTVTATFTVDSNHEAVTAKSATLTIDKATYNMSGVTMSNKTVTYNGTAQSITYSGTLPTGVTLKNYTYNGAPGTSATNAGTYTVACVFNYDTTNYYAPEAKSATLKIDKADIVMTNYTMSPKTVTYNGTAQSITMSGTMPAGITAVSYTYDGTAGTGKTNAGTYTVAAVFTYDTTNYNAPESRSATLEIRKANIVMTNYTMSNKTVIYNGTAQSITMSGTMPKGITAVSYTYNNVAGTSKTDAGTYTVKAVFTYDTVNYNAPAARSATLKIDKATINMSGISFSDRIVSFDGSSKADSIVISGTLPSTISGVTYTYKKGGANVDKANVKEVGSYEVTATFAYDAKNYNTVSAKTATLTIVKGDINFDNVSFDSITVKYDGLTHNITLKGDLPEGITVNYVYYKNEVEVNKADVIDVDVYTVHAVFGGYNPDEYVLPDMVATVTIEKANKDMSGISFENIELDYDGQKHVPVIGGTLPEGVTVTYKYEVDGEPIEADEIENVGVYTVTAVFTLDDTHNFNAISDMVVTVTINPATADMSGVVFDDINVVYDGQNHTLTVNGELPVGVTVTYTYEFNGEPVEAEAIKNVGEYTVTAHFDGKGNYNEIADKTAKIVIGKADVDMSGIEFNDASFENDGQAHTLAISGNLPAGVTVTYVYTKDGVVVQPDQVKESGEYTVTAVFTLEDTLNYNAIADMTAKLTIEAPKGVSGGIIAIIAVSSAVGVAGIATGTILGVRKVKFGKAGKTASGSVESGEPLGESETTVSDDGLNDEE